VAERCLDRTTASHRRKEGLGKDENPVFCREARDRDPARSEVNRLPVQIAARERDFMIEERKRLFRGRAVIDGHLLRSRDCQTVDILGIEPREMQVRSDACCEA
jgi:hypothetical protein